MSPKMRETGSKLIAAKIRILNMTGNAQCLLSMVAFGLAHTLRDPEHFRRPFKQMNPSVSEEILDELAGLSKEITHEQAINAAQAACLVFVHAGCESSLMAVAEALACAQPDAWLPLLRTKKVSVAELTERRRSAVIQARLREYLWELERDSILIKTKVLFAILQLKGKTAGDYSFSEAELRRIDNLRHECAHGKFGVADFSRFSEDLEYLHHTADFFIDNAAAKLGIEMPTTKLSRLMGSDAR